MTDLIKIRASLQGDVADVKVLMNHPMETGQRKDSKTGQLVPAHYIQTVTATLNGRKVMEAQWSQAISKNPFLGFKVKGARLGDRITVSWVDTKGEQNSAEAVING
jgi:sulfur-oxidizing protein SoxZ